MERCLALYFYEYYATAANSPIDERRKETLRGLKSMSAVALLAGQILHRFIRLSFTRPDLSEQWLQRTALSAFDEAISFAENPKGQAHRLDDRYPPRELVEFSYANLDGAEAATVAREKLDTALNHFFKDPPVRAYLRGLKQHELEAELRVSGMKLEGWTIGGQIDLLAIGDESCEVADWKLGKTERGTDSLQLHIYGEFAAAKTGLPREQIFLRRVFLGDAVIEAPTTLTQEQSSLGRTRLLQDIELMEELHQYGQDGREGVFTQCNHMNVCRRCKFQAICHKTPMNPNSLQI